MQSCASVQSPTFVIAFVGISFFKDEGECTACSSLSFSTRAKSFATNFRSESEYGQQRDRGKDQRM
jgi:hypothetical protein